MGSVSIDLYRKEDLVIGKTYKVVSGGLGAYGANGLIGEIISKPKRQPDKYQGEFFKSAEVYIDIKGVVWGLCNGWKVKGDAPKETKSSTHLLGNGLLPLNLEEWSEIHEQDLDIELAESGADREMCFNREQEYLTRYNSYLYKTEVANLRTFTAFQHWLGANYNSLPTDSTEMTKRARKYYDEQIKNQ